ncbi:hypothetical protein AVEN_119873-1, partial [Araneus ventricosus]
MTVAAISRVLVATTGHGPTPPIGGLYAESHGFVQNMMYDAHFGDFFLMAPNDTASVSHWWDSAEPLWITAEKKGLRSALYWWDGCQVEIRGSKPTFCRKYKYVGYAWPTVNDDTREALLTALQLLQNNEIHLVQIYYEPVDFYADSEVPVPENTTQEEANSSSEVLINTPQINLQPAEPGNSSVKPPSPTKHIHKISPILRLSQATAKHRIKKTAVLLASIDNRNAIKANLEKLFQKCHKFGPNSIERKKAVKDIDSLIDLAQREMATRGLLNKVNFVVLSDHGMTSTDSRGLSVINLNHLIDMADIQYMVYYGATSMLLPYDGKLEK